jgi:hypothetical protein
MQYAWDFVERWRNMTVLQRVEMLGLTGWEQQRDEEGAVELYIQKPGYIQRDGHIYPCFWM